MRMKLRCHITYERDPPLSSSGVYTRTTTFIFLVLSQKVNLKKASFFMHTYICVCIYKKYIVRRCALRCFLRSLKIMWPRSLTYVRIWVYLLVSLNGISFHSLLVLTSDPQNTTAFVALKEIVVCQFYLRLSGFHCGVFLHSHLLSRYLCIFSFFYPICRNQASASRPVLDSVFMLLHGVAWVFLFSLSLSLFLFPFYYYFFYIVSWSRAAFSDAVKFYLTICLRR